MSAGRAAAASALIVSGLVVAGCAAAQQRAAPEPALLAPARVAALPAPERVVWERYLERSRAQRQRDRDVLSADLRAAGLPNAVPAPSHDGFFIAERMTDAWLGSAEATALADAMVSYQTPAGGWSKRLAFEHPRRPGESWTSAGNQNWLGTFDNGATTEQLRFLARFASARPEPRYRDAFLAGLEYLLAAQFPNGCWPQIYPLVGSYHDAITFNDDAVANVLRVLQQSARGEPAFVPAELRARVAGAAAAGIECLLRTQVVVAGQLTIWGQQHDPLTLQPVRARAYEHASLASKESAQLTELLMSIDAPPPRVGRAVHAAAQWFQENALYGFAYEAKQGRTPSPGAGPLWARFAELGSNRAIFSNRDGVVRYDFDQLDEERRSGYGWYTEEPAGTLKAYRDWVRKYGVSPDAGGGDPRL